MSLDISRFRHIFFAETQQHLSTMETLLLELDVDDPDIEQIIFIIHEVHAIACSSGLFGFTDLADVAQALECLLGRIGRGDLPLLSEMTDVSLAAGDLLKAQLDAHREGTTADPAALEAIFSRLKQLPINALAASHDSYGFFEPAPPVSTRVTTA